MSVARPLMTVTVSPASLRSASSVSTLLTFASMVASSSCGAALVVGAGGATTMGAGCVVVAGGGCTMTGGTCCVGGIMMGVAGGGGRGVGTVGMGVGAVATLTFVLVASPRFISKNMITAVATIAKSATTATTPVE